MGAILSGRFHMSTDASMLRNAARREARMCAGKTAVDTPHQQYIDADTISSGSLQPHDGVPSPAIDGLCEMAPRMAAAPASAKVG
jgi:hypothetical protein